MPPKRGAAMIAEPVLPPIGLEVLHGFGSHAGRAEFRDAVAFADVEGQFIAQPVGRQMAFRHLAGTEVSFAVESSSVQAVSATAVSQDRSLLAVCQLTSSAPSSQVSVYELGPLAGKDPVQTLEELGGSVGRLVAAAFSASKPGAGSSDDPNGLLCLSSAGLTAQIIVLDWKQNELIGRAEIARVMDRVAFNPLDGFQISVSCSSSMELWLLKEFPAPAAAGAEVLQEDRLESMELAKMPEVAGLREFAATFTDHAWLLPACGQIVACSEEGTCYVLSNGRDAFAAPEGAEELQLEAEPYVLCSIDNPFGVPLTGSAPRCIRCFPRGFIVAGTGSALAVWQLQDREETEETELDEDYGVSPVYVHEQTLAVTSGAGSTISSFDLVEYQAENKYRRDLVVAFENSSITHFSLSEVEAAKDKAMPETPLVCGGFHAGPITGLDMAVQRPILVSACSKDCTVRVWDYQVGSCEVCWHAPEEPMGVALHPFGFFLALGFSDKVRLMHILAKELVPVSELPVKNARSLRFSHGGHLLAIIQSKLVHVFSSRTLKKVAQLKGQAKEVASISFDPEDKVLVTMGEDGRMLEFSTKSWLQVNNEGEQPRGESLAVAAGPDGRAWAGVCHGDGNALRAFRHCNVLENEDIPLPPRMQLSAMSLHKTGKDKEALVSVIAGDCTGALRVFSGLTTMLRSADIGLHSDACTAVCVSSDARTVATAGADGSIFVINVEGVATDPRPSGKGSMEVVMINRGDIQQRQDEIAELSTQTSSLKTQIEEDAARLQSETRARVEEARRKDQERVQSLRLKYESLQQASTAKERENLRQMKSMEAMHIQAADEKERVYDKQMRMDAASYVAVEDELKELESRLTQHRDRAKQILEDRQQMQMQELRRQTSEKDAEIMKVKSLIKFTQQRFDAMLDQEGMEQDMEIAQLKQKNDEELEQQHLVEYKLKKDQDSLLRGLDMMEKDRERIANEQRESSLIMNNLKHECETMQREVKKLKDERKEREATLRDKEVEIGTHKLKVQTLKKFKHVLDYRLREVTESLIPKEEMISQLHAQLEALEAEFERQLEMQKTMEQVLAKKTEQVAEVTTEVKKQKEELKQREKTIFRYTTDLDALATTNSDSRNWHIGLKKIWQDHVDVDKLVADQEGSLPLRELGRQVKVMERKARILDLNGSKNEDTSKADIISKTQENSLLIHELDELRVEKKALERQLTMLELRVRQSEQRRAEEEQAALALGHGGGSAQLMDLGGPKKPPSREFLPAEVPDAVKDFFEEAPRANPSAMKGQAKKTVQRTNKSAFHKNAEEREHIQKLMKAAEQNNDKMKLQRIEQKLLQDQLNSLRAKKKSVAPGPLAPAPGRPASAGGTPLSSGLETPASAQPPLAAGGGLSAVRAAVQAAPTPTSTQPGSPL
eukprot:TRINITY_DN1677_c0_g1_i1.p1 TRINITY_DN1677_c0_g1~~TRINITY_DN1677_c0_g1_i1.p1  ORF type:complete len:1409 (-),score=359.14 TRINITY_DN1677_c0_g1_i1:32-4258(-)